MRRLFVHPHIPECGRSGVKDALIRNFGASLLTTNGILNDYQYNAEQIGKIIDQNPSLICLTGHKISLDLPFEREDLDIKVFTWIQDPVDRFASHYFFHKNHTHSVPETKSLSLLDYTDWALRQGKQQAYINGQVRFLTGGSMERVQSLVDDGRLLLFPFSELQLSLFELAHRFPESFRRVRVKSRKSVSTKDQDIPDSFRRSVLPFVRNDMKLLELAQRTMLHKEHFPTTNSLADAYPGVVNRAAVGLAGLLRRVAGSIERRS